MSYIGAQPTTGSFPFDQFSGDGSTTAFTLTYAPASPTSIIVAVSGVVQNPNTYSCIGTTLTFSGAPPSGTNNISVLYLGLPVIGVSSPGNTAYFSSTSFTATASQTTFTPSGSYTPGFINVIRNGAQLAPADYTATNGTTVVLNNACTAGDIVVIEVYTLTSIANAIPQGGGTFTGAVSGTSFSVAAGTLYPLVSGTAVTASGTLVDFTGIPSTAKRVTVMFNNVSTNSTNAPILQIGPGTSPETSGYTGYSVTHGGSGISYHGYSSAYSSDIKLYSTTWSAAYPLTGKVVFDLLDATTNTWVVDGVIVIIGNTNTQTTIVGAKALVSALGMVRVTINGTDTFDAGTINIMWE
jgi:hypothetical protein